jgi:hypothetical protein
MTNRCVEESRVISSCHVLYSLRRDQPISRRFLQRFGNAVDYTFMLSEYSGVIYGIISILIRLQESILFLLTV